MTTELTATPGAIIARHLDPSILAGQVREPTIAMYRKAWKDYTVFAGDWTAATRPETLAKWRAELAAGNLSPNTINQMLSSARAVMKQGAEQGYINAATIDTTVKHYVLDELEVGLTDGLF